MPRKTLIFFAPVMQKHDNPRAVLLCGVGMAYPLIGFFAPQTRILFTFLE